MSEAPHVHEAHTPYVRGLALTSVAGASRIIDAPEHLRVLARARKTPTAAASACGMMSLVRAAWMTDIHLNFLGVAALRTFYERVREAHPDVLFVTGDIAEADSVVRYIDELAAIAPLYFVLGNHDYYHSSIERVRARISRREPHERAVWMRSRPVSLTPRTTLVGVDGWGDARCGDLGSPVMLSDWQVIKELRPTLFDLPARIAALRALGADEARTLESLLARAPASEEVVVLTHVPPFADACFHEGRQSEPEWLPWFTCVATGEVLLAHAHAHPQTQITVLCGHTHGEGTYTPLPNLTVRTGGWPPGVEGYGNPIVNAVLDVR